jgi:hypothetical protein
MPKQGAHYGQHQHDPVEKGEDVEDGRLQIHGKGDASVEAEAGQGANAGHDEHEAALKQRMHPADAGVGDERGARERSRDQQAAAEKAEHRERQRQCVRQAQRAGDRCAGGGEPVEKHSAEQRAGEEKRALHTAVTPQRARAQDENRVERARHAQAGAFGEQLPAIRDPFKLSVGNRRPAKEHRPSERGHRHGQESRALRIGKRLAGALISNRGDARTDSARRQHKSEGEADAVLRHGHVIGGEEISVRETGQQERERDNMGQPQPRGTAEKIAEERARLRRNGRGAGYRRRVSAQESGERFHNGQRSPEGRKAST